MSMKKFLGLGFAFNATDKGLKSGLRETKEGIEGIGDETEDAGKKSSKFFDGFGKGLEKIAAFGIGSKIAGGISKLTSALDEADETARNLGSIDAVIAQFQAMGQLDGPKNIQKFVDDLGKTAVDSAADIGELTEYVSILQKRGFTFDEIKTKVDGAADSMGRFNLSSEEAANFDQFSKAAGFTGLQVDKLKEKLLAIGKETGYVGALKDSVDIIDKVSSTTSFQNSTLSQREQQILSLTKAQSLFNKGLGDGQKAGDAFGKIMGIQKEFTDLKTGVSSATDQFQEFMLASGGSGAIFEKLKKGDTLGFLKNIAGVWSKSGKNEMMLNRLTNFFGEDTVRVIKQMADGTLNLDKGFKAAGARIAEINVTKNRDELLLVNKDYRKALADNIDLMKRQLDVAKDATDIQAQVRSHKWQKKFISERIKAQNRLNKSLYGKDAKAGVLWDSLRAMKEMEGLSAGGKLFFLLDKLEQKGINVKNWIPAWANDYINEFFIFVSDHLLEIAFLAPTAMKVMGKGFGLIGKGFGLIGKGATKVMGLFGKEGGIAKGIGKVGEAFTKVKDVSSKVFGVIKSGGTKAFDAFKTGSKWISKAGNYVSGLLGKMGGLKSFGKILGKVFGKILIPIGLVLSAVDAVTSNWENLKNAFKDGDWMDITIAIMETLRDFADSFLLGIPSTIAGVINGAVEGIMALIDGQGVDAAWTSFKENLAEGASKIPFVGSNIADWLRGDGASETASPAAEMVKPEATGATLESTPMVPLSGAIDNSVINNTSNSGQTDENAIAGALSKAMGTTKLQAELVIDIGGKKQRKNVVFTGALAGVQ